MKESKLIIFVVSISLLIIAASQFACKNTKNNNDLNASNNIPVTTYQAKKEIVKEKISIVGTIVADKDVAVVSEAQGKVISVNIKVGDRVAQNSVIAKIDDELLRANYISAEAAYTKLKKDFEIYEKLLKDNSASTTQYEAVKLQFKNAEAGYIIAKRRLNDASIKSPISGIITSKSIETGQMVNPGMTVANVVDISRLKVKFSLSEKNAFLIKKGEIVSVTSDIYPGVEFMGKVESISDKADKVHNYAIEVTLDNSKEHPLRAGMFGKVMFNNINEDSVILIPREAILLSVKDPQVFVISNGIAKLRDVVVGDDSGLKIRVLSGLSEGESVVVSGVNNLRDGYHVDVKSNGK